MLNGNHWLLNKPIAHRGLWGGKIIENSVEAYKNAVENNYPIEIDLYESTDGVLFSFHDGNLLRMCNVDKNIFDLSSEEIKSYNLMGTDEKIPTFDQVLETVNGKVPILVEIKNQPSKNVVYNVCKKLDWYCGEFALQSFNPLYINQVRKLRPDFLRGLLVTREKSDLKGNRFINRFVVKNMSLNFLVKPHFISINYKSLPLKKGKRKNLPLLAWTVTSVDVEKSIKGLCDNIIFEHYIPDKKPI